MPEKKDQTPNQDQPQEPQQPAQDPNAQPTPQPPAETPPSVDGTQPVQPVPEYRKLDETVPGGRYKTADGRTVDANGEPFKE